ncbi:MAG: hypothetical protein ACRDFB_05530 [Rhabdochlamydiaceae bacterium]
MKTYWVILVLLPALASYKICAAQWYTDSPTPAEIAARDKPYTILQNEIEGKLCNADWGIDKDNSFSFLKDDPGSREVVRGKTIHYFDLTHEGNQCAIKLKETSSLYNTIQDSIKKVNVRMIANLNTGITMQQAMSDAMKNGGNVPAKDQAILNKKGAINKECMKDITRLSNAQQFGTVTLLINEEWMDDEETSGDTFIADAIKNLTIPGVQHAYICVEYPGKDEPDTTYRATLYFGNWPKPDLHKMLSFPFKYITKYGWVDKAHSGPPTIENFIIYVQSFYYNDLMKAIHGIDWTKLDPVIKR